MQAAVGDGVTWRRSETGEWVAPQLRLMGVTDDLTADAGFVLHHTVADAHSGGAKVVLASATSSLDHFIAPGRKLGVRSTAFSDGSIVFVDVAEFIRSPQLDSSVPDTAAGAGGGVHLTPSGLSTLDVSGLTEALKAHATDSDRPTVIVLDDLTALENLSGCAEPVLDAIHNLKVLTRTESVSAVMLAHSDVRSPGLPSIADSVADACDIHVSVAPLSTGHSVDVHGCLTVVTASRLGAPCAPVSKHHFKVLDSGVRLFQVGSTRL